MLESVPFEFIGGTINHDHAYLWYIRTVPNCGCLMYGHWHRLIAAPATCQLTALASSQRQLNHREVVPVSVQVADVHLSAQRPQV